MSMDDYDDEPAPGCPYCASVNGCTHLLLLVDLTFRSAGNGTLMEAFNDRWSKLCEEGGDDFDETEPFESLLDEIAACADSFAEYDFEGGPGMSSSCAAYYVESAEAMKEAVARFESEEEP